MCCAPLMLCSTCWGQRSISGFFVPFLAIYDLLSKAPVFTTVLPSCNQVSAILKPVLLLVRSTGVSFVISRRFMLPEPTCFIDGQCCLHFKSHVYNIIKMLLRPPIHVNPHPMFIRHVQIPKSSNLLNPIPYVTLQCYKHIQ